MPVYNGRSGNSVHDVEVTRWLRHPKNRPYCGSSNSNGGANEHAINKAESSEAIILGEGEKKLEMKLDTRTPNTVTFTFNKEDHTLANLLRDKLLTNSHVTFSGYKVPHPLFAKFELRVQTDGEITPKEALLGSCKDLVGELNTLRREFTKEYALRKMVGNAQNGY